MNSAIIFQGQGSYRTSYFKRLVNEKPKLNSYLEIAENILEWSPKEILHDFDNIGSLSTDYAQPMIFLMEYIGWCAYKENMPEQPEFMMGHSLGEIIALSAAGVFSFEQGLEIVKVRGRLMQEASESVSQGMLAILGMDRIKVEELCRSTTELVGEPVFCANYNGERNIVVSGSQKALNYIAASDSIKCRPLQVTKAFHTEYMRSAAERFRVFLNSMECSEFAIPVISNVTAMPYQRSWSVKNILYRQIFSPVLWRDSICYLKKRGIDFLLQVSDSGLYESMDREASYEVMWGNIKDWTKGRYYNYNALYPSSRSRKKYRPEIGGEVLSSMISDPWPENIALSVVERASKLFKATIEIFANRFWDSDDLLSAIGMLKEVLTLKQLTLDNINQKCQQILNKYGIELGNENEKIF